MEDLYKLGWNDRVCGRNYQAFKARGGWYALNVLGPGAPPWGPSEMAEYVRGWDAASAKILALEIKL